MQCVFNEYGEVVRGEFVEGVPRTTEGNVRGSKGEVGRGLLSVNVVGFACGG